MRTAIVSKMLLLVKHHSDALQLHYVSVPVHLVLVLVVQVTYYLVLRFVVVMRFNVVKVKKASTVKDIASRVHYLGDSVLVVVRRGTDRGCLNRHEPSLRTSV